MTFSLRIWNFGPFSFDFSEKCHNMSLILLCKFAPQSKNFVSTIGIDCTLPPIFLFWPLEATYQGEWGQKLKFIFAVICQYFFQIFNSKTECHTGHARVNGNDSSSDDEFQADQRSSRLEGNLLYTGCCIKSTVHRIRLIELIST